jgi:hypothetical protein
MLRREGVRSVKIKHSVAIAGIDLCHIYIYICNMGDVENKY